MKLNEIIVEDYQSTLHMSFDEFHISNYSGIFKCPGLPIDGKRVVSSIKTFKPFKKGNKVESSYTLEGEEGCFDTIKDLVLFYCKDLIEV